MRGLILYDTKYCSTLKAAKEMKKTLGECDIYEIETFIINDRTYDYVILGCYVYNNSMSTNMQRFIKTYDAYLSDKSLFAYVMMLEGDVAQKYLQPMIEQFGDKIKRMKSFGGRMELECLTPLDFEEIKQQLNGIKIPFRSFDLYQKEEIIAFANEIKSEMGMELRSHEKKSMLLYVWQRLSVKNVAKCVLSVSQRPVVEVEYRCLNNQLYVTSLGRLKVENQVITLRVCDEVRNEVIELLGDFDAMTSELKIKKIMLKTSHFNPMHQVELFYLSIC